MLGQHLLLIARGEIRADLLPRIATVLRSEQVLVSGVDDAAVVLRDDDRRHPLRAQLGLGVVPHRLNVRDPDGATAAAAARGRRWLSGLFRSLGCGGRLFASLLLLGEIDAAEVSVETVRIDDAVVRIDRVVRSLAARRAFPRDGRNPVASLRKIDPASTAAVILNRAVRPDRRAV